MSATEKEANEDRCPPCNRLVHDLNWQEKKTEAENPNKKFKRQDPSSRARLQYMSPLSQQKCKMHAQYQRTSSLHKLKKYEDNKVVLDDEQNSEMVSVLEATQPDELEKLFKDGEEHGVGSLMKIIWYTDKDRQKNDFCQDQERNSEYLLRLKMVMHEYLYRTRRQRKQVKYDHHTDRSVFVML